MAAPLRALTASAACGCEHPTAPTAAATLPAADPAAGIADNTGPGARSLATREQQTILAQPTEWTGPIMIEGLITGDARRMEFGAMTWRDLPLPLSMQTESSHGGIPMQSAQLVGNITRVYRLGPEIWAEGVFDHTTPEGRRAAELVATGKMPTVSVDLDDLDVTWEPDDTRTPIDLYGDGDVVIQPERLVYTRARLMGLTMVPHPALQEARLSIIDRGTRSADMVALAASAAGPDRMHPGFGYRQISVILPARWGAPHPIVASANSDGTLPGFPDLPARGLFSPPIRFEGPTHLTVRLEPGPYYGEVYGHLALWNEDDAPSCHLGRGGCVTAPRAGMNYHRFATGSVPVQGGGVVGETGVITVGCSHAPLSAGSAEARRFYEQNGAGVADVRIGEDEWGIWVHGAMRSTATWAQVRELMGGDISGDWRWDDGTGGLELIGILGVVQGGFHVPGVWSADRGALVAALTSVPREERPDPLLARLAYVEAGLARLSSAVRPLMRLARDTVMRNPSYPSAGR